jgi:hypothetical protein
MYSTDVNIRNYGALGDGTHDDGVAANSMLSALGFLVIPDDGGVFLLTTQVIISANQWCDLLGIVKSPVGGTALSIRGNNGRVVGGPNGQIQMNGSLGGVNATGPITGPVIQGVTFTGAVAASGTHIIFIGDGGTGVYGNVMSAPVSRDNTIIGADPATNGGGEIFESCNDYSSERLTIINQGNYYGHEARWSQGKIRGIRATNPEIGSTQTGDGSTKAWTFNITSPKAAFRTAIQVNAVPIYDVSARYADGAITSGTTAFTCTSAGATFTAGDVGKSIIVAGAGASGGFLFTTISAYVSAHAVTLSASASTTVSNANYGNYTFDKTLAYL